MRIAVIAPIAWRTPPRHYGPWEQVASLHTEGLIAAGENVTLFATADSITRAQLEAVCSRPYEEDRSIDAKVWECLHIAHAFERAREFDIIHNHYDFVPLSYTRLVSVPVVTTIHGFSSPRILPAYRMYNDTVYYVSISNADRAEDLTYAATIYHGLRPEQFTFESEAGGYLLSLGRIHPDKGTREAIEIARACGLPLRIAGIVQDERYFREEIAPFIGRSGVTYEGTVGPDDRDRLLGGARALLHPISFAEPFGLSVAEAMMCGTPVIAFNRGSMPELVQDGTTGFLVDSVESAVDAVARVGTIDRTNCRTWAVEQFSADRMVRDYLDLYRRILAGEISPSR